MVLKIFFDTLTGLLTKLKRSSRKKKAVALVFLTYYFISSSHYNLWPVYDGTNEVLMDPVTFNNKGVKRILYWNTQLLLANWGLGLGSQPFEDLVCKVQNCELWESQDTLYNMPPEDFDAIMFRIVDENLDLGNIPLPTKRRPEQRYIYFNFEAPSNHIRKSERFKNFYNWTYTHRRDSDIFYPYGIFANMTISGTDDLPGPAPEKWRTFFYNNMSIPDIIYEKTRLVAWFNTDILVPSKRKWYVEEMAHYIDIDIYGGGGTHTCIPTFTDCNELLENKYKFYLAFENALCTDYITEKLFRTLQYYVVPIVYGGEGYKAAAPPMSYIDVQDYESPAHLVEYLLYLHENPEEYAKYFWWKPYYEYIGSERVSLCKLCEKLNDPTEPEKVYADVGKWWNEGICHTQYEHFQAVSDKWVIGQKRLIFNLILLHM